MTTPIPAGWKPLPATMTLDMSVAFAEAWYSKHRAIDDDDMQDAYATMLAAAPEAPPITVALDPDPRGVSVGVWQGSSCIYTGAHAVPASVAPGDAQDEQTESILWWIMRQAQEAKEPCGDDPESPAAVRNAKLAGIGGAAAQALGLVRGPDYPAPAAGNALDKARLDWLEQHNGRFFNKDRISSIVGTGFLVAGDEQGVRHQTVRAAIDAAMAVLAAQVPQQGEA